MGRSEAQPRLSAIHPITSRWLALIEDHGSQATALAALFRQVDELERLKRAVRGCGLSPELLLAS